MALSDRFKKQTQQVTEERQRLAIERAKSSVQQVFESEQFKLSALSLPENQMAVDSIVQTTVKSILDPVAQFTDTLRAKGFRKAEIRGLVHNLFKLYNLGKESDDTTYEQMQEMVAYYVAEHQELYNTFDPAMLRE